jgi:hypothetical protein
MAVTIGPKSGPYNERLGYAQLPSFIEALSARHFVVTRQARWSQPLERFVDQGGYAIYGEKTRAGVKLFDRDQNPLYEASYPERAYKDLSSIPPLVVDSLLFIEGHDLCKTRSAIQPSNGAGSCSLWRDGSPASQIAASEKAAPARLLPRSKSFAIRLAAAHPASPRNSARWSRLRRGLTAMARRRLQPAATS